MRGEVKVDVVYYVQMNQKELDFIRDMVQNGPDGTEEIRKSIFEELSRIRVDPKFVSTKKLMEESDGSRDGRKPLGNLVT